VVIWETKTSILKAVGEVEAEEEGEVEEEAEEEAVEEVDTEADSEEMVWAQNHLVLILTVVPTRVTVVIPLAMVIILTLLFLQELVDVVGDVVVAAVACVEAHVELVKILVLNQCKLK